MSQDRQIQLVISVMLTAGFEVSERFFIRPRSFDLIARNNGTLLVIKVVSHIDSVSEEVAFDLEVISRHLGGVPLIVGERHGMRNWNAGCLYPVWYLRDQSRDALRLFRGEIPPLVYASQAGCM